MTKLYRAVVYVLDLNGNVPNKQDVTEQLQNNKWPEFIDVQEVLETEIGGWDDSHKLNQSGVSMADYDAYFAELMFPTGGGDQHLKEEYRRVRGIMLAQIQKNGLLEKELEHLRTKIKGLEKVQEFVRAVNELSKG